MSGNKVSTAAEGLTLTICYLATEVSFINHLAFISHFNFWDIIYYQQDMQSLSRSPTINASKILIQREGMVRIAAKCEEKLNFSIVV